MTALQDATGIFRYCNSRYNHLLRLLPVRIPDSPTAFRRYDPSYDRKNFPVAGIVASLIRMDHGLGSKGDPMIPHQHPHCFQHEIDCQRITDDIGQNLPGVGIRYGGQICKASIIRDIRDICQEDSPGAEFLKLAFEKIPGHIAGLKGFCHAAVWACLMNRTHKIVFFH